MQHIYKGLPRSGGFLYCSLLRVQTFTNTPIEGLETGEPVGGFASAPTGAINHEKGSKYNG